MKISASMMCAKIHQLPQVLRIFEEEGIDYLHIDVMDGVFVPNYTLGTDYIRQLRELTSIPLDIHLMVEDPDAKLEWFGILPGEFVAVHAECCRHLQRPVICLRTAGGKEDFLFLYLQGLCDLGSGIFYILLCLHSLSVAGRGISVILCHKLHRQVLYFI